MVALRGVTRVLDGTRRLSLWCQRREDEARLGQVCASGVSGDGPLCAKKGCGGSSITEVGNFLRLHTICHHKHVDANDNSELQYVDLFFECTHLRTNLTTSVSATPTFGAFRCSTSEICCVWHVSLGSECPWLPSHYLGRQNTLQIRARTEYGKAERSTAHPTISFACSAFSFALHSVLTGTVRTRPKVSMEVRVLHEPYPRKWKDTPNRDSPHSPSWPNQAVGQTVRVFTEKSQNKQNARIQSTAHGWIPLPSGQFLRVLPS